MLLLSALPGLRVTCIYPSKSECKAAATNLEAPFVQRFFLLRLTIELWLFEQEQAVPQLRNYVQQVRFRLEPEVTSKIEETRAPKVTSTL